MGATGWAEPSLWFVGQAAVRATLWLALTLVAAWALRRAAAATRRWLWVAAIGGALLLPLAGLAGPIELEVLPPARFTPLAPPWLARGCAPRRALGASAEPCRSPQAVPLQLPPAARGRGPASRRRRAPARPASVAQPEFARPLRRGISAGAAAAGPCAHAGGPSAARCPARHRCLASAARRSTCGKAIRSNCQSRSAVCAPVVLVPDRRSCLGTGLAGGGPGARGAHVRSRDPLWQLLAELACVLYWFHPLIYLAARQLRVERELAADDAALGGGMRASEYARLLYELACVPDQHAQRRGRRAAADPGRPQGARCSACSMPPARGACHDWH